MKILFSLLRPVHLRNFDSTIRLLAARGHSLHLSFSATRTREDGLDRAKALALEYRDVSVEVGPLRRPSSGWRDVAGGMRLLGDFGRYLDPRFRRALPLRTRAEQTLIDALSPEGVPFRIGVAAAPVIRWLGAHPSGAVSRALIGLSRLAETAVPASPQFVEHLRIRGPDVVLISPAVDFGSDQVEYLKAAHQLGIPCAVCVASWDNLTNKGLIKGAPDLVFVWNDVQRQEAAELHGVDPLRVRITGAPRFDEWFRRRPTCSAGAFRERIGLDPALPHVVYLCSSGFIAPDEPAFVWRWARALRESRESKLRGIGILVRPHPQNATQWAEIELGNLGNAVIWPRQGADVIDDVSRRDFYDSIAHSVAAIGINTSAQIEACILGKHVLTVLDARFGHAQLGTVHYHYLRPEQGGFLHEAQTLDEHVRQLCSALREDAGEPQTARFLEHFVRPWGLARPATPLLVDAIERMAPKAPSCSGTAGPAAQAHLGGLLHPRPATSPGGPSSSDRVLPVAPRQGDGGAPSR